MKTQIEIYNTLYKNKIFTLYPDVKASRIANKYAIQNTWRLFNEQFTRRTKF